jgi:hypothetical protein
MAKPVTLLVVFFVAFNFFAGMLLQTGVAQSMGIDGTVGEDKDISDQVNDSEDISSGTGEGDDLFGLYNVVSGQVNEFFGVVFPGLRMLNRAGVPSYITGGFLAPIFSIITFVGVVSFLRGTDL